MFLGAFVALGYVGCFYGQTGADRGASPPIAARNNPINGERSLGYLKENADYPYYLGDTVQRTIVPP